MWNFHWGSGDGGWGGGGSDGGGCGVGAGCDSVAVVMVDRIIRLKISQSFCVYGWAFQ